MAEVQELVIKYRAEISDLQGKVEQIEKALGKAGKAGADAGKKTEESFKKAGEAANPLAASFENLGKTIIAAFAIERVIAFGKECVKSFQEAELSARKLQSAVSTSGGLQKDFDTLIKQSSKLQSISIFSDETIQGVQTADRKSTRLNSSH